MSRTGENRASDTRPPHVAAQVAASWSEIDAAARSDALAAALREMQTVRDFVGSPSRILGSDATKHGEIAEQVNVGIRRSADALLGRAPSATFEGVGRFAPTDYRMDGMDIQSKYYSGLRGSLGGVLEHSRKHPDFSGGYQIPRDQYAQMERLNRTGAADGLSEKSANAVRDKLDALRQSTGRAPDEIIQPGETDYAEVQKERVKDTISDRENGLRKASGPSLSGLGKAAGIGAAVGGGFALTQALWAKYREGKNPFRGQFSAQDWRDVGVASARGGGGGAVAGGALYLITSSRVLSAPVAGAVVSGLIGVGALLRQYGAGRIDGGQFVEMSQIVAADAAIVGLATVAGQALIPIPVLGALIGSFGGKFVASAIQSGLGNSEKALTARLDAYAKSARARLDAEFSAVVQNMDAYFGSLERIAETAFDEAANASLRLRASAEFAESVGVPNDLILRGADDLDAFMTE